MRGAQERKRWMKGRWEDDSTAVMGSHHSSAIFTKSPPIYLDCLCVCYLPSGRERATEREAKKTEKKGGRECLYVSFYCWKDPVVPQVIPIVLEGLFHDVVSEMLYKFMYQGKFIVT